MFLKLSKILKCSPGRNKCYAAKFLIEAQSTNLHVNTLARVKILFTIALLVTLRVTRLLRFQFIKRREF